MRDFCVAALPASLAFVSLGGAFYEFAVVDPFWPRRPDLIQSTRGGISRRRFWIPAHVAVELALVVSLLVLWPRADIRMWLLVGLASHAAMRVWSALYFIPKALAFERAESPNEHVARAWTLRSRLRLPI